jgi:hypothetical protein
MPNWVTNYLTINGEEEQVSALVAQVSTPYERSTYDFLKKERVTWKVERAFSFWNIVKPTDLKAYEDCEDNPRQEGEGHWYGWNLRNWGVKWDTSEVEITDRVEGAISYRFDTPWGVPEQVITTLSEQYPALEFVLEYEEETGWGGAIEIKNGLGIVTEEYDFKCHNCDATYRNGEQPELNDEGYHACQMEESNA